MIVELKLGQTHDRLRNDLSRLWWNRVFLGIECRIAVIPMPWSDAPFLSLTSSDALE